MGRPHRRWCEVSVWQLPSLSVPYFDSSLGPLGGACSWAGRDCAPPSFLDGASVSDLYADTGARSTPPLCHTAAGSAFVFPVLAFVFIDCGVQLGVVVHL